MICALFIGGHGMISNEYELAWVLYGVAALGCFWVWTFFTRWMWRYLREPLWLAVAVLLFSPTLVDPNGTAWVPSLAMAAMDIAFKVNNDAWRALADIMLYGTVAFTLYLIFAILRFLVEHYWLKPRRAEKAGQQTPGEAVPQTEPTLRELLDQKELFDTGEPGIVARR